MVKEWQSVVTTEKDWQARRGQARRGMDGPDTATQAIHHQLFSEVEKNDHHT